MANSQRLATVRSAIEGYLSHQVQKTGGETLADAMIQSESILIRQEHYCGRKFLTATHRAIWFLEEDEVKIFTADNRWCVSLRGSEIDRIAEGPDHHAAEMVIAVPIQYGARPLDDSPVDPRSVTSRGTDVPPSEAADRKAA